MRECKLIAFTGIVFIGQKGHPTEPGYQRNRIKDVIAVPAKNN